MYRLHCTVWLSCYTVTELYSKLILPILLNCRLYALPQLKLPSHVCTPGCKLTTSINQLNCIVQRSDVCESQVSFKYCTVVQCQFIIQYSLFTTCYIIKTVLKVWRNIDRCAECSSYWTTQQVTTHYYNLHGLFRMSAFKSYIFFPTVITSQL